MSPTFTNIKTKAALGLGVSAALLAWLILPTHRSTTPSLVAQYSYMGTLNESVPSDLDELESLDPKPRVRTARETASTEFEALVAETSDSQALASRGVTRSEISSDTDIAFRDGTEVAYFVTTNYLNVFGESGQLVAQGGWKNGAREGEWTYFNESGGVELSGHYREGLAQGRWLRYDSNGSLLADINCKDGELHGKCEFLNVEDDVEDRRSGYYVEGILQE